VRAFFSFYKLNISVKLFLFQHCQVQEGWENQICWMHGGSPYEVHNISRLHHWNQERQRLGTLLETDGDIVDQLLGVLFKNLRPSNRVSVLQRHKHVRFCNILCSFNLFNFFSGCRSSTVVLSRNSSRCVNLNRLLVMAVLGLVGVMWSAGNGLVLLRDLPTMVAMLREQLLEVSLFLLI